MGTVLGVFLVLAVLVLCTWGCVLSIRAEAKARQRPQFNEWAEYKHYRTLQRQWRQEDHKLWQAQFDTLNKSKN